MLPEITESISDLPRRIKQARNDLAHHLARKAPAPLRPRVLEWLVVAETTSWILRCLLLLRAGFDPETLRKRLFHFQRFGFFRANTAQHVRELDWELPLANFCRPMMEPTRNRLHLNSWRAARFTSETPRVWTPNLLDGH